VRPDAGRGQDEEGEEVDGPMIRPFQHEKDSLIEAAIRFYISHRRRPIQTAPRGDGFVAGVNVEL
jgi:hypothetical protein